MKFEMKRWVGALVIGPLFVILTPSLVAESETAVNKKREVYQQSLFVSFDQNKNGKLSREEFVKVIIGNLFKDFDKNKNGRITQAEFYSYARDKDQAKKEYSVMDTEKKGFFTLKNVYRNKLLVSRLEDEFKRLDKTNKGYVTLSDLPDLTPEG